MLARALDRAGQVEQVAFCDARRDDDLGDRRAAEGQRPGLVEHDGVHAVGHLERLAAADQDAGLGAAARSRP